MARVNITTKPGQGAGQQGELFLNTLLDTPVETIGTDILQPSVDTIQGVTADAPQAIEGAPLTIDQQMARVGQDEIVGEQLETNKILPMRERAELGLTGVWSLATPFTSMEDDGGTTERAKVFQSVFPDDFKFGLMPQALDPKSEKTSLLTSAINNSGAYNPEVFMDTGRVDPKFMAIASAVTENTLLDYLEGVPEEEDPFTRMLDDEPEYEGEKLPMIKPFATSDLNTRIGKQLSREYQRSINSDIEPVEISKDEATVLGDAVMKTFVAINGGFNNEAVLIAPVFEEGGVTRGPKRYQLTPLGIETFAKGNTQRKKLFPKQVVRPLKSIPVGGRVIGQAKELVKGVKSMVNDAQRKEAARNLSTVPHVVDKNRSRLLLTTFLAALRADQATVEGESRSLTQVQKVYATINNFGNDKFSSFIAKEKTARAKGFQGYSANGALGNLRNSLAQSLFGIATERKGANYLTYYTQTTGRMAPQQTLFDPVSSKMVRFVTRNAVPVTVRANSRQEVALRQMFAIHLVEGADMLMPQYRDGALALATPQMVQWGRRLQEVADASMSDAEVEAVMDAIAKQVPFNDPSFPPFKELALDPVKDEALLEAIASKGEDGLLYMDGLMDFAKYYQSVKVDKVPYHTYFNAYIDGKTNGLAAWGMILGDEQMATMTGVIRSQDRHLLDNGDIRDHLKEALLTHIDTNGFKYGQYEGSADAITGLAKRLFSEKALNKYTTMTFGYGRALESFGKDLQEFMEVLREEAELLKDDPKALEARDLVNFAVQYDTLVRVSTGGTTGGAKEIAGVLLVPYIEGLTSVVSPASLAARSVLKAVAASTAMSDMPLMINTPTGMVMALGGNIMGDFDSVKRLNYSLSMFNGDKAKAFKAYAYEVDRKSAASVGFAGIKQTPVPGLNTLNNSIVAPVHATDAATVIKTASGKSWKKLRAVSNNNPFLLTIYDALKMDANGYDTVVTEVNNNWVESTVGWDLFGEYMDAQKRADVAFKQRIEDLIKAGQPVSLKLNEEFQMMGFLTTLHTYQTKYGTFSVPRNLENLLGASMQDGTQAEGAAVRIKKKMKDTVGFDFNQTDATPKQVEQFNRLLNDVLDTKQRLAKFKKNTDIAKSKMMARIKKMGISIYQYYAH
tara:strand:+ start:1273 stop:4668 length:3396 start_codon:yes stop_codon:yes gene_type:complete